MPEKSVDAISEDKNANTYKDLTNKQKGRKKERMKEGSNLGNQLPRSRITHTLNPEGNFGVC